MDNRNKFFFGSVKDFQKKKGWFFGHFAEEPLLKSSLVEVAWQSVPDKKPEVTDKHFHKKAVEITIVLQGSAKFLINGIRQKAQKGDFWVVYPETIIEDFATGPDTELLVIKAPSIKGDKYIV